MNAYIAPFPPKRPASAFHRPTGEVATYDDDLPPELFDEEEDREDLNQYVHIAELAMNE